LNFIRRYMDRFGRSPAETDIQRHFLVSAPSVNQMVRTLERRGFIERDRDGFGQTVPRSIRVLWDG
ncbi:MAG: MarR family transcriptional regulator, partial [Rhodothermales bacterium]|nr:MarR family transcriptional regulator [Rhodothermales bacterium]